MAHRYKLYGFISMKISEMIDTLEALYVLSPSSTPTPGVTLGSRGLSFLANTNMLTTKDRTRIGKWRHDTTNGYSLRTN